MNDAIEIRRSLASDVAAIEKLYPEAFPDEDLLPLVAELLRERQGVLSLVAVAGGDVVGHVAFTACGIAGTDTRVALLAPLAVTPARQQRGVGGALVREGLRRMETEGTKRVYVLGDPGYYGRFGFSADDGVVPPYPLPEEWRGAWQSLGLGDRTESLVGQLCVPQPWRQEALWAS